MPLILVADDTVAFRDPIAASLRAAGHKTMCALDGDEAFRMTLSHRPDLILLDVSMPKMNGLEFLRRLRGNPAIAGIPVILLTALSEKKDVLAAAAYGVRDYFLKSCFKVKDLLLRVEKMALKTPANSEFEPSKSNGNAGPPSTLQPITDERNSVGPMTREQFLQRVKRVLKVNSLSGVVSQVIAVANSPLGDTAQLAGLIARDPILSARVLQAANSAAFACAGTVVTTLRDAIRVVGFTAVRNIAAAIGVFDCLPKAENDGFSPIRYWQHSLAVAQLCEKFVGTTSVRQVGLAYVVGLCHDLSEIFMRTQFDKEYQFVNDNLARTGQSKEQAHREVFGISYSEATRAVLECMSLPKAIREPIEMFHSVGGGETSHPLASILWLAENYANSAMLASSGNSAVSSFVKSFCISTLGVENPACPNPRNLRSEVLCLTVALANLSRTEEAKLLTPLFKTRPAKVWVARHSDISEFDPVGTALESLAEVTLNSRLPANNEVEELDGLVIVATTRKTVGFSLADVESAFANLRKNGLDRPVLAICCHSAKTDADATSWRTSITLSNLAAFVESLNKNSILG